MKHPVGVAQDGVEIYADLTNSKAGKRISRQPQLLSLAKEMFSVVKFRGQTVTMEHDMHRQIGYEFIIKATEQDAVFYARLVKDSVYTRFIKNRQPTPTSYLTVTLQQGVEGYELTDIWIGRVRPPRPGSDDETAESRPYWSNHALILGDQSVQAQTLTKTCPY